MVRYKIIIILVLLSCPMRCTGQDGLITRFKASLPLIKDSFQLVDALNRLAILLYENNTDSTFLYADKARQIAVRMRYKRGMADASNNIGICYDIKGEPELSLRYYSNANNLYKQINDSSNVIQTWMNIAMVYDLIGKKEKSLEYFNEAISFGRTLSHDSILSLVYSNYVLLNPNDPLKQNNDRYLEKALSIANKYNDQRVALQIDQLKATQLLVNGNRDSGLHLLQRTANKALAMEFNFLSLDMLLSLGDNYIDSIPKVALSFYQQALQITKTKNYGSYSKIVLKKLHSFYVDNKNQDSAYNYSNQLLEAYETQEKMASTSRIDYIQYALKEQELESVTQISESNTKISILATIAGAMAIIVAVIFWVVKRKATQTSKLLQLRFQQLESTSRLLEASNDNYARVLKVVAHDLRNPLSNIFLLSKMTMEDRDSRGQSLEFAKLIHQISDTCISQIGDLMKADLGIGEESIVKSELQVASILSESILLLGYKAKEKNQVLVLQAESVPAIFADKQKLERVINNLLTNAIKFSGNENTIIVNVQQADNGVVIAVKDSGIGIPDNLAATLFEPFTNSRRRGTAGEETFGLGLYICKKIVEAHRGRIWFESQVNQGTTFFVWLPK